MGQALTGTLMINAENPNVTEVYIIRVPTAAGPEGWRRVDT
jgi:hypothetical protein